MIPVLAIPALNRPDLLRRCLGSIDEPIGRLLVIDNSPDGSMDLGMEGVEVIDVGCNLGVAASWNLVIRANPAAPWWAFANLDTEFAPGDLARLAAEMAQPGPRWVGMNGDWRVFGLSAAAVEAVGWFDENFHPIYCEDADYERRCTLAGVPWYSIPGGAAHVGSVAYRSEPRYAAANGRTYPENVAYYERKWGGSLRGGERFGTPFDVGGSVRDWTLDLSRLRVQAW